MIVPRSKLLVWVAMVVLPFAAVAGIFLTIAPVAIGVVLLFLLVTVLDAVRSTNSLDGIAVMLPPVTRFSKDREGKLELEIHNDDEQSKQLRVGFAFPAELATEQQDLWVALPEKARVSKVQWSCTPVKRGNYVFGRCFLERPSAFGFWSIRKTISITGEIRVYPNLLTERKSVAALFLNRGNFGAHAQRHVGKGRDFEKLRDYIPGDSYEDVHWKATAKRGKPVTKIFQIERTQEVYVIIDSSRLTARELPVNGGASTGFNREGDPNIISSNSLLERFITAGLVLGLAAEQQGDLFGLITFGDKVQNFIRAKNGKAHYAACRDALYTLHPRSVTPDFDELCTFIRLRLRRRALLVFLTSLDDPVLQETFTRNMDLICRQHLILVNMMQPAGVAPLFSDAKVTRLDDVYRQLGGHVLWNNLRELEKILQHRGVRFSLLENEKLSAQLVSQYLDIKRRQIL